MVTKAKQRKFEEMNPASFSEDSVQETRCSLVPTSEREIFGRYNENNSDILGDFINKDENPMNKIIEAKKKLVFKQADPILDQIFGDVLT